MARPVGSKGTKPRIDKGVPNLKRRRRFCLRGHDTFVCGRDKNSTCVTCRDERNKNYQELNKEDIKTQKHDYYENNKETFLSKNKAYQKEHENEIKIQRKAFREEHKEELRLRDQEYYNLHKDEILKRVKKWAQENPDLVLLYSLKQHAQRKLRVPNFGQDDIRKIVTKCPTSKVIDHIVPLQGKNVSGLHVSWNLQYLTPKQNSVKHNKCNLLEISEWYGQILEKEGLK